MKWITRERPKIDRIACPWLIQRFVDPAAEFLYVPKDDVLRIAEETGAIPYDVPNVELTHVGELCSFDAILAKYGLADPVLQQLASSSVPRTRTGSDLAPQGRGTPRHLVGYVGELLRRSRHARARMVVYDALYSWCRTCQGETHDWRPRS